MEKEKRPSSCQAHPPKTSSEKVTKKSSESGNGSHVRLSPEQKIVKKVCFQELHDIEVKQQELERQGVKLEKTIRELCNKSDAERVEKGLDNNDRDSLGPEAEDLIMQLFELVNEKVSKLLKKSLHLVSNKIIRF